MSKIAIYILVKKFFNLIEDWKRKLDRLLNEKPSNSMSD